MFNSFISGDQVISSQNANAKAGDRYNYFCFIAIRCNINMKFCHSTKYYHSAKPEYHRKYSRKVVSCWLARDRTQEKERRLMVNHEPI